MNEEASAESKESFRAFVTRHATSASRAQLLSAIAVATGATWLGGLVFSRRALALLTVVLVASSLISVALWGLIFGHARRPPTPLSAWTARGLLLLAMVCAVLAALTLMLALLGQPWMS